MAQMGTGARLTLQVYAQVIQRQRIDCDLVWGLMRFPTSPSGGPDQARARRLTRRMTQRTHTNGGLVLVWAYV
jgi:hypothetical protein